MATQPIYTVHPEFDDPRADVVLVCPKKEDSAQSVAFKVQRRHLQAHSTVFQNTLQPPASPDVSLSLYNLPAVILDVDAFTMEIILGMIYDLPSHVDKVKGLHWEQALAVWEATHKYKMENMRASVVYHKRQKLCGKKKFADVLYLYVRAKALGDAEVAQAALDRALAPDVMCRCNRNRIPCPCDKQIKHISLEDRLQIMRKKFDCEVELLINATKAVEESAVDLDHTVCTPLCAPLLTQMEHSRDLQLLVELFCKVRLATGVRRE